MLETVVVDPEATENLLLARSRGWVVAVIKALDEATIMEGSSDDSAHMKDLVRCTPYIEPAWSPTLWNSELVHNQQDVHC